MVEPNPTRIKLRNDTSNEWYSANPTLADGEVGIERDTNRLKIGNASQNWNEILYAYEASYDPYTVHMIHDPLTAIDEANKTITVTLISNNLNTINATLYVFINNTNTLVTKYEVTLDIGTTSDYKITLPSLVLNTQYRVDIVDNTKVIGRTLISHTKNYDLEILFSYTGQNTVSYTIRNKSQSPVVFANPQLRMIPVMTTDSTGNILPLPQGVTNLPSFGQIITIYGSITIVPYDSSNNNTEYTGNYNYGSRFVNGIYYLIQFTFDSSFIYKTTSDPKRYTTQLISEARFNPNNNLEILFTVSEGENKFQNVILERIRMLNGNQVTTLINTITTNTISGNFEFDIVSNNAPITGDIYHIIGVYQNNTEIEPVILNFIQKIEISKIAITSQNSFITTISNIDGSGYNLDVDILDQSNNVLLNRFPVPISNITNTFVQLNASEVSTYSNAINVDKRGDSEIPANVSNKPFYGICVNPFNSNTKWLTYENIKNVLTEALKFSYRIRLFGSGRSYLPYDAIYRSNVNYSQLFGPGSTFQNIFDQFIDPDRSVTNFQAPLGYRQYSDYVGGQYNSCILLHRILEVIKRETDIDPQSEFSKIQIYVGISISEISAPTVTDWVTNISSLGDYIRNPSPSLGDLGVISDYRKITDLFYVIEKFGTDNICGIALGNEVIHHYVINSSTYGDFAQRFLLNRFQLIFEYMRKRFVYYYCMRDPTRDNPYVNEVNTRIDGYTSTSINANWTSLGHSRYTNRPIKYIPIGINETPNVYNNSVGTSFNIDYIRHIIRLSDFTGINNHPYYNTSSYPFSSSSEDKNRYINQQYDTFKRTFLSCSTFIKSVAGNDNIRIFVSEVGFPGIANYEIHTDSYGNGANRDLYSFYPVQGQTTPPTDNLPDVRATINSLRNSGLLIRLPLSLYTTSDLQMLWATKVASSAISDGIDFYYFSLTDNYLQAAFRGNPTYPTAIQLKGNYVIMWGLYTYNRSYYDIVNSLSMLSPPRTYNSSSSTDNYRLSLVSKHQQNFLSDTTNNIFGNKNRDFSHYVTEYPDVYYVNPFGFSFTYGTTYKFRYRAGGQPTNILPPESNTSFYTVSFNSDFTLNSFIYKSNSTVNIGYTYISTGNILNTTWYIIDSTDPTVRYTFSNQTVEKADSLVSSDGNTVVTTPVPKYKTLTLPSLNIFEVGHSYRLIINTSPSVVLYESLLQIYEYSPLDIIEVNKINPNIIPINIDFLLDYDSVINANIYYIADNDVKTIIGTQRNVPQFNKPSTDEGSVESYSITVTGENIIDYYGTNIFVEGTFIALGKPNLIIRSVNFPLIYDETTILSSLYIKYDKSSIILLTNEDKGFNIRQPAGVKLFLTKKIGSSYTRIAEILSSNVISYISGYNSGIMTYGSQYNIDWIVTPSKGQLANIIQTINHNLTDFLFFDYNQNITITFTVTTISDYNITLTFNTQSRRRRLEFDIYETDTANTGSGGIKINNDTIVINTNTNLPFNGILDDSSEFIVGKYYHIRTIQIISSSDSTTIQRSPSFYINYPTFNLDISFNKFGSGIVDGKLYYRITNYSGLASSNIRVVLFRVQSIGGGNYQDTSDYKESESFNSTSISDGLVIESDDFGDFITRNQNYRAYLYFNDDINTKRGVTNVYQYSPMYISDINKITVTYTGIIIKGINWINKPNPPSRIPKISIIIKRKIDIDNPSIAPVYSVENLDPENDIAIQSTFTIGTEYTVQISIEDRNQDTFREDFLYNRIQFSTISSSFQDIDSTITGLGNLIVKYTTNPTVQFNGNTIAFTLYEYDGSVGGSGRAILPSITGSLFGTNQTLVFNTNYLTYGKFYSVYYELSNDTEMKGTLLQPRVQYLANGFDIIVLAGADNMVGRDRDEVIDAGFYRINNEKGGYPQLTEDEIEIPLKDKNGNIVRIYNFNDLNINYTNDLLTNEKIPILHRISGNMKPYRLNISPPGITLPTQNDGISCGYQFAKYYSELINIPANRRLCVVNSAVPLSRLEENPPSSSNANVWLANKGYSKLLKNALEDISKLKTFGNIEYATDKIRYKNSKNALKYGCNLKSENMFFSQQIVDNFDYGYLVDYIHLTSIHPTNTADILNDNPGSGYDDTSFRNMLNKELYYLRTGILQGGHTPFNYAYRALLSKDDYTLDTNIYKYADFLRDNEMKLRINGLIDFTSNTLRTNTSFWLNTSNSRINSICGLMRHVYYVINWFETNYPGLVIGYDIIRNYSSVSNIKVDGRDERPSKLAVIGQCMRFADKESYTPSNQSPQTILNKNDRLFIEAIYIAAYAALGSTSAIRSQRYSEIELGWSDSNFTYFESRNNTNARSAVDHAVTTVQLIKSNYGVNGTPINTLSFQAAFTARNFLVNPNNYSTDTVEFERNTNTLFLTRNNGSLLSAINHANTERLRVTFTEFEAELVGGIIPGGGGASLLDTQTYWGRNYANFRTFQYTYFLNKMYSFLRASSTPSNVNKGYLGFGTLISKIPEEEQDMTDGYNLNSFFFGRRDDSMNAIETQSLNQFLQLIPSTTVKPYTSHRVVAFLWAGGGRNYDENDSTHVSRLIGLFDYMYSNCLQCIKRSTAFIVANFEQGFITRRCSTSFPLYNYNTLIDIDRIDTFSSRNNLQIKPVSTIGLHSIDPNAPVNASRENNGYIFEGCFSARSQRLLGLRMFNRYIDMSQILSIPTTSVEIRSRYNNTIIPTDYKYSTITGRLENIVISSCSYKYDINPIAYLLSSTYKVLNGPVLEDIKDSQGRTIQIYGLITEYNTDDRATSTSTVSSKSMICYFSTPPETPTNSRVNNYPGNGSSTYNINNILRADYTYDDSIDDITTVNRSVIKEKYLSADISQYIRYIGLLVPTTDSRYKGINIKLSSTTRNLGPSGIINNVNKEGNPVCYLPPISMSDWKSVFNYWRNTATTSGSMYRQVNPTTFPSITSNNLSHVTVNSVTNTVTIVGYDPNQNPTTLPSEVNNIRLLPRTSPSRNVVLVGQFIGGMYFSNFKSNLDDISFFTKGTSNTLRTVGENVYVSKTLDTQSAGINIGRNPGTIDPSGEVSRIYSFFFIRNSNTYIKINLNNVFPNKTYTIEYKFAVQSGRIPYNKSGSFDPDKNLNINGITYNFLLQEQFPLSVYYNSRSNQDTPIAKQEIYFTLPVSSGIANTITSTTSLNAKSYVHSGGEWDGSWKDMKFRFKIPSGFNVSQMYLQIGPIESHIETTFYFRDFILGVEN